MANSGLMPNLRSSGRGVDIVPSYCSGIAQPHRYALASTVLLVIGVTSALAQLSPNAPKDQAHPLAPQQIAENERALAPYIKSARTTYPAARTRYLAGLPPGEHFFVVTRLVDSSGHWEQVFVRVTTIDGETITGIISSDIGLVSGFKAGQSYSFR
jgi:hypothetical protein